MPNYGKSKYQRKKPLPEVVTQQEIYQAGENIQDKKLKCFFFYMYLTGCRISEALQFRAKNLQFPKGIPVCYCLTLKNRTKDIRPIPLYTTFPKYEKLDKAMAEEVIAWIKSFEAEELVFEFKDRFEAYNRLTRGVSVEPPKLNVDLVKREGKKIKQIKRIEAWQPNPHYLRHCRATHLSDYLTPYEMQDWFGWSNPDMALIYLQRNPNQLLDKAVLRGDLEKFSKKNEVCETCGTLLNNGICQTCEEGNINFKP